eukprot:scaffold26725_cov112-Isochrysis_galbana.AAC.5
MWHAAAAYPQLAGSQGSRSSVGLRGHSARALQRVHGPRLSATCDTNTNTHIMTPDHHTYCKASPTPQQHRDTV